MSTNPNTVKSQDDLSTTNDGKRSSDVLVEAISKLERTTIALEKVKKERDTYHKALMQIQYETPALGGDTEDMEHALCNIDWLCNWALRPEEMKEMEKMNEVQSAEHSK